MLPVCLVGSVVCGPRARCPVRLRHHSGRRNCRRGAPRISFGIIGLATIIPCFDASANGKRRLRRRGRPLGWLRGLGVLHIREVRCRHGRRRPPPLWACSSVGRSGSVSEELVPRRLRWLSRSRPSSSSSRVEDVVRWLFRRHDQHCRHRGHVVLLIPIVKRI